MPFFSKDKKKWSLKSTCQCNPKAFSFGMKINFRTVAEFWCQCREHLLNKQKTVHYQCFLINSDWSNGGGGIKGSFFIHFSCRCLHKALLRNPAKVCIEKCNSKRSDELSDAEWAGKKHSSKERLIKDEKKRRKRKKKRCLIRKICFPSLLLQKKWRFEQNMEKKLKTLCFGFVRAVA